MIQTTTTIPHTMIPIMTTKYHLLDKKPIKFRHELKYNLNYGESIVLSSRLSHLFERDPYAGSHGSYRVSSLYFDTPYDKALKEKMDGVRKREKFRLRYYNEDKSFIRLEKKIKYRGLCGKRHAKLHLSEVKKIVDGDIAFLLKSEDLLLMEFYSKLKGQLLKPKALVVYDREAFIYRPGNVRVTLDRNLSTSSDPLEFLDSSLKTRRNMADGMIVLEVKYDEFLPDIVKMAVSEMGRSHTAYSKYAVVRRYE